MFCFVFLQAQCLKHLLIFINSFYLEQLIHFIAATLVQTCSKELLGKFEIRINESISKPKISLNFK